MEVDEIGVDEMRVDEMEVDILESKRSENKPYSLGWIFSPEHSYR